MTSHDAVGFIRKTLGIKKVGHAGTLDPGAAGVLPVCLGNATRLAEYISEGHKAYRAEITFGIATETLDAFGNVLEKRACSIVQQDLEECLQGFIGEIEQVPPMYSAVKYQGKKLYELARSGQVIDRPPRLVHIFSLSLVKFEAVYPYPKAAIDVVCSKGTYIRSLCADIALKLGCCAHMSFLVRTRVGEFTLGQAITLEEIKQQKDQEYILPLIDAVRHLPLAKIVPERINRVLNGQLFPGDLLDLPQGLPAGQTIGLIGADGQLLGTAVIVDDAEVCTGVKISKIFK